ncbi:Integrase core domain protein [Streptococcus sanguinis]|mgnify:FL=1|jgi:integrase|uniref:IS30 family transposase n=1 Tax=Streptococcus sanguinis TaxID=1305 RepID=UPI0007796773|nr:IS30 family transposase [Streptococcus sanguinis]RSI05461.1 Integrase core domain protein [Streptococcus sanguinis]
MGYLHVTIIDRLKIEAYLEAGFNLSYIATELGFHRSSISREIKRCPNKYSAEEAQRQYEELSRLKGRKTACTSQMKKDIERHLKASWSPEQIHGRYQYENKPIVAFKTIYNWIYNGQLEVSAETLRRKGKTREPHETRGKFIIGKPISKRPKEVKSRQNFGHWELDTMVSSRGKSKGCLATFVERKTRFYLAFKIPDRSARSMFSAIETLQKIFPKNFLKTFTSDRGKEFACYPQVEALGIDFYFADAYSSWQRGSNENSNGLLREYFPKRTNLADITDESLVNALLAINHRPRKCLGYKTAFETLMDEF